MFLNVPLAHFVHVPAVSAQKPTLQVQAASAVLLATEFVYSGQAEHELTPIRPFHVPTPQPLHVDAPGILEYFPDGHAVHVENPVVAITCPV